MKSWPNLIAMFREQAEVYGDKPFLWAKKEDKYESVSWKECNETVSALARGLKTLGLKKGDRVLLCSESRPEWVQAYYAIMSAGGIAVPAYTTNTQNDHAHIISNSGAKGAIVSSRDLAANLVPAAHQSGIVNFLISIEDLEQSQSSGTGVKNIRMLDSDSVFFLVD